MIGAPVLVVVLVIAAFLVIKANQKPAVATGAPSAPAGSHPGELDQERPGLDLRRRRQGHRRQPADGDQRRCPDRERQAKSALHRCGVLSVLRGRTLGHDHSAVRFGTFTNLGVTTSSSTDVYPSTATLSLHGATYTSTLLSFTGAEQTSNISNGSGGYTPLDTVAAADVAVLTKYDTQQGIRFVDFGNKYMVVGSSYLPIHSKGCRRARSRPKC